MVRANVQWRDSTFSWIARCPRCSVVVWSLALESPMVPEGTPHSAKAIGHQVPATVEVRHQCNAMDVVTPLVDAAHALLDAWACPHEGLEYGNCWDCRNTGFVLTNSAMEALVEAAKAIIAHAPPTAMGRIPVVYDESVEPGTYEIRLPDGSVMRGSFDVLEQSTPEHREPKNLPDTGGPQPLIPKRRKREDDSA